MKVIFKSYNLLYVVLLEMLRGESEDSKNVSIKERRNGSFHSNIETGV
jgi:hypothetical protein